MALMEPGICVVVVLTHPIMPDARIKTDVIKILFKELDLNSLVSRFLTHFGCEYDDLYAISDLILGFISRVIHHFTHIRCDGG